MKINKQERSELGAAATEFALLLPILVVLSLGVVDLSTAYYYHLLLDTSLRSGAQLAWSDPTQTSTIRSAIISSTTLKNCVTGAASPASCPYDNDALPASDPTIKFYCSSSPETSVTPSIPSTCPSKQSLMGDIAWSITYKPIIVGSILPGGLRTSWLQTTGGKATISAALTIVLEYNE